MWNLCGLFVLILAHLVTSQEWEQFNGKEYFFGVNSPDIGNTWHSARGLCQGYGGDLVSITSEEEREFIYTKTYRGLLTGHLWIGLNYLDRDTWKWSDDEPTVPDYWAEGFPIHNNDDELYLCAHQHTREDGIWYNDHCDTHYGYICKRSIGDTEPKTDAPTETVDGYCPTGYFSVGDNKCFKVVLIESKDVGLTWQQAVRECRAGPGIIPDLASVHSEYENAMIMSQMQKKTFALWIGYSRPSEYDPFRWADNSATQYVNWASGEPLYQGGCVELWNAALQPGTWNNEQCINKRGYVCQTFKSARDIIPTPNPTTPNTCRSDYTPYWYGCYKLYSDTYEWNEAQSKCEVDGGNLVSMHSAAENAAIFTKVFETGKDIWIGLNNYDDSYTWSDGWHVIWTEWGVGQPSRAEGGGCVAMKQDGKWYDTTCTKKMAAICKVTLVDPLTTPAHLEGECPEGNWLHYGEHCYIFEAYGYTTWSGANLACQQKSHLATLASIHSYAENNFIVEELSKGSFPVAWIGIFRSKNGRNFHWIDTSIVQYTNWAPGEPNGNEANEDCGVVYINSLPGLWDDQHCNGYQGYICKAPKVPHPSYPPTRGGTCPEGWVHYYNQCFYFQPNAFARWENALMQCSEISNGRATLVSIESALENEFIFNEMRLRNELPDRVSYWIGLLKNGPLKDGNDFFWVDGTKFEYSAWGYSEPSDYLENEDCTEVMQSTSLWNDNSCDLNRAFVCKMPLIPLEGEGEGGSSSSLSTGSIVGIVFGVLAGIILLTSIVVITLDYFKIIDVSATTADAKTLFGLSNPTYDEHNDVNLGMPSDTVA